jgi:hypothetical protein
MFIESDVCKLNKISELKFAKVFFFYGILLGEIMYEIPGIDVFDRIVN